MIKSPPKLSIIIPTLNEEVRLAILLASLQRQSFTDFEIIVADAGSRDSTVSVAENFKARLVKGGLPAIGRNNGARVALGEILLFLDADIRLDNPHYLEDCLNEFLGRDLIVATSPLKSESLLILDRVLIRIYDLYSRLTSSILPHLPGFCIFVKRQTHELLNGFDESVVFAEDMEYGRRASRLGTFGFLQAHRIPYCNRRLERDGRLATSIRYLLAEIYMLLFGAIRNDIFRYRFGYSTPPDEKDKFRG